MESKYRVAFLKDPTKVGLNEEYQKIYFLNPIVMKSPPISTSGGSSVHSASNVSSSTVYCQLSVLPPSLYPTPRTTSDAILSAIITFSPTGAEKAIALTPFLIYTLVNSWWLLLWVTIAGVAAVFLAVYVFFMVVGSVEYDNEEKSHRLETAYAKLSRYAQRIDDDLARFKRQSLEIVFCMAARYRFVLRGRRRARILQHVFSSRVF